jgi:hypothetical protein
LSSGKGKKILSYRIFGTVFVYPVIVPLAHRYANLVELPKYDPPLLMVTVLDIATEFGIELEV